MTFLKSNINLALQAITEILFFPEMLGLKANFIALTLKTGLGYVALALALFLLVSFTIFKKTCHHHLIS